MKNYVFLSMLAALFFSGCASSKQLIINPEKAESWTGKVEFAPDYARDKGPCFILYGKYPTPLTYKDYIPVSPDKTYIYKVSFRTLDPKLPASGYMGLDLYDENKRKIGHCHVQALLNAVDSEVISARKGDNFLIVKMMEKYDKLRHSAIAFNARKDFSDLPNFDISPQCAKITPDKDGNLRIELKGKLKKDYPAGTPIRIHSPWSPSMYYLASGWVPANEGKDCTAILRGVMDKAGTSSKKFWKGTKYVRPFVWFGNWNRRPQKGAKLLVDGFSFEETDKIFE